MKTVYSPESLVGQIEAIRDALAYQAPAAAVLIAIVAAAFVASAVTRARF